MDYNISKIIRERRATPPRFFSKDEISKEMIETLLENANWAPTHKKTEPWRFKVFKGDSKNKLAEKISESLKLASDTNLNINQQTADKFRAGFDNVPIAIAIILQRDEAERVPEWQEIAAVAMAVQNMWLTATASGLGAFWSTPGFLTDIESLLGVLPSQKLLGFFYVGKLAIELPSPGRGDIAMKTEWFE